MRLTNQYGQRHRRRQSQNALRYGYEMATDVYGVCVSLIDFWRYVKPANEETPLAFSTFRNALGVCSSTPLSFGSSLCAHVKTSLMNATAR